MSIGLSVPILPARDLLEARAFYERLGFETVGYWPPEEFGGYAIVERDDIRLHFVPHQSLKAAENYAACYWYVEDADSFYEECQRLGLPSEGIPRVTPIEDKPWGMREFALVDPSGNLMRIGQGLTV